MRDAGAVADLLREHPSADAHALCSLVSEARRERAENRPPKRYRELFQALRALLDGRDG